MAGGLIFEKNADFLHFIPKNFIKNLTIIGDISYNEYIVGNCEIIILFHVIHQTAGNCFAGGREIQMSEIRVKENESLDSALRRFKRQCAKSGVMSEIRKREHYEKPSVKRKKKSEAARKRKFK